MKKILNRLSLILILICSCTIFFACKSTAKTKLQTPYNIEFFVLGDTLGVQVSNVLNAEEYVLYIDGHEFTSKNGYFEIDNISGSARKFCFSCKAVAKNYYDSNESTNFYYTNAITLETPKLFVTNEFLTWTGVSNAKSYNLFVNNKKIECTDTNYKLSNLTGYGKLNIKVQAINKTNDLYLDSDFSNEIIYDLSNTIKPPTLDYIEKEKKIKIISYNVGNNPSFCVKINDNVIITSNKEIDISNILKNESNRVTIVAYEFYDSGVKSDYSTEIVINNYMIDNPILISLQNTINGYKLVFNDLKEGYYHHIVINTNNINYTFNTLTNFIEVSKEFLNNSSVLYIRTCSVHSTEYDDKINSDECKYNISNIMHL